MKLYGLIGFPLTHSFSKKYFLNKFEKEKISYCHYELFSLSSLRQFEDLLQTKELAGLNVTIPYKEKIIPYLDELDTLAAEIGAVNTIKIDQGQSLPFLKGYNTDLIGFRNSLKPYLTSAHDRALIFGSGGASKAVARVLSDLSIPYFFVSRNPMNSEQVAYSEISPEALKGFRLLINCTPLGTYPKVDEMIPLDLNGLGEKHLVYDLVYHPAETKLMRLAAEKGATTLNGLSMLKLQAEASWEIWSS